METIWTALGLEPTKDVSAIKRAYAEKAKTCHPEENPEGFLQLRRAYQEALSFAGDGEKAPAPPPSPEEPEDQGWSLTDGPAIIDEGPNPFADHPAAKAFLALYTGKQRKNPQAWMDYFTSGDFLEVGWKRRFAGFLLEQTVRLEGEYPLNKEFLGWLYIVYQFTVDRSREFQMMEWAQFDGQKFIFEIAKRAHVPKTPRGNELAMSYSFREYLHMVYMAEHDAWSEQKIGQCSEIVGRYAAGYITDKCQQRGDMDYERHPAGLRLMTHFFRREGLPDELYRIVWEKLDLKTALMGRAKILYGPLRELALERLPELAGQRKVSFAKLRKDFSDYAVSTYKRRGEHAQATEEDIRRTDDFFSREDFQQALLDRRFIEEDLLHTAVSETRCDYFLQRVIRFYQEHGDAPCAQQVVDRAKEMLRYQALADRLRRDRETKIQESGLTLKSAPFFRHWLNTGFSHSMERETKRSLLGYLNQELPYLPEWSRSFLGVEGEETLEPVSVTLKLGRDKFTVQFHLRYQSFLRNGEPIHRPCLIWEQLMEWAPNSDTFLHLLPVTAAVYNQYDEVRAEILRRLEDTAAPKEGRVFIAACLADQVCGLPIPDAVGTEDAREPEWARSLPPVSFLPYQIFAENTEVLYVCIWFQRDRVLALFQQTPYGQKLIEGGEFHEIEDAETAKDLAKRLLDDQLHPKGFPMEALKVLPESVYAKWDYVVRSKDQDLPPLWSTPVELHGEAVTLEKLEELLTLFSTGRVERMEWSWKCAFPVDEAPLGYEPRRSLVLMKSGGRYVCLYFDDFCAESFALLEKPENYGKEKSVPRLVPFRQSRLFPNVLHGHFFTIRRHLEKIFSQISWPNYVKFMAGGIWDYAVNVDHGRVKYNLDKQLLGDFPAERAHNRPDAPFYFYFYPDTAVRADDVGEMETLEVTEGNRSKVQRLLSDFLAGGGQTLRLTWGRTRGTRRHIVLRRDGERFLMAWIREDQKTVEFHVADRWTYMDVEGKKYPKDSFLGSVTPAYLIHDLSGLRNALDLLLANLDRPERITSPMGEYAWEKPGKPRPYEALWAELVGDALVC
nr:hypothetical protein [uncultured Oscillibacter sp.]